MESNKASAMVSAINNGDILKLEKLLKEANQKNPLIYKDEFGIQLTALHYSAQQGRLEIFKSISDTLTNLNPKSIHAYPTGVTPLHFAADKGRLNIVTYITKCIQDINPATNEGFTPMHFAADSGQKSIIDIKFTL